jgi:hypothetical protein
MAGDRAVLNGGYPNAVTLGAPPSRVVVASKPSALKEGPTLGKPKTPPRDPLDLLYGLKSTRAIQVDGLMDMTQADQGMLKCHAEYTQDTSPYLNNRGTLHGVARTHDELAAAKHAPEDGDAIEDGIGFREKMI